MSNQQLTIAVNSSTILHTYTGKYVPQYATILEYVEFLVLLWTFDTIAQPVRAATIKEFMDDYINEFHPTLKVTIIVH